MEINYTFIIPHKDSQQLLYRCINSIPQREDIQIIVVDDNSNNKNFDMSFFAERHVELVLSDKCLTAGGARNVGLDRAKGKWILFADADDYYVPNFLSVLDSYTNLYVDIVFFDVDDSTHPKITFSRYHQSIKRQNKDDIVYLKYGMTNVWCKMFRASMINRYNIRFECSKKGNDVLFTLLTSFYSKHITIVNTKLYCYTYLKKSITYSPKSLMDYVEMYKRQIKYNYFVCNVGARILRCSTSGFVFYTLKECGIIGFFNFWTYFWKHKKNIYSCRSSYLNVLAKTKNNQGEDILPE